MCEGLEYEDLKRHVTGKIFFLLSSYIEERNAESEDQKIAKYFNTQMDKIGLAVAKLFHKGIYDRNSVFHSSTLKMNFSRKLDGLFRLPK